MRASMSTSRRQRSTRSLVSISTRSPMPLPKLSLIWRKRSRSTCSSANGVPSRRASASA